MGIRDKIKKTLPIIGGGNVPPQAQPAAAQSAASPPAPATEERSEPVGDFIDGLVKNNKLFLFMKGAPQSPMCGFSANAAGILQSYGVEVPHFDVLSDPDVRQGIKDYSDWPTIPQVYVGGEFLGGSDILMQMHQSGELKTALEKAGLIS